jgi:hypothetical protein
MIFTLNNVIKIFYIIFAGPGQANQADHQARPNTQDLPCLPWRAGGEARARPNAGLRLARPAIFHARLGQFHRASDGCI